MHRPFFHHHEWDLTPTLHKQEGSVRVRTFRMAGLIIGSPWAKELSV